MANLKALFHNGQVGFTVYSPDCAQSRLWGNLDHAIHDATGFQAIYRQWINHDVNSITRFYNSGGVEPTNEQDPDEYARKFDAIPAADLKYGHLVMKLFLSGPCLLTIWQGESSDGAIPTLFKLKGRTQPAQAASESIRGRFWCDNGVCNLLHVSDDLAEAERELKAVGVWDALDVERTPLPLIEPIPAPTDYVAHSGISVVCDVVNRLLAGEKIDVYLPPSGDAKETNAALTPILREAAQRWPKNAPFIEAFLRGDLVAVSAMMKKLPVTKWEYFIIQCGAINRDTWDAPDMPPGT